LTPPNPINFVIADEDCIDIGHASVLNGRLSYATPGGERIDTWSHESYE